MLLTVCQNTRMLVGVRVWTASRLLSQTSPEPPETIMAFMVEQERETETPESIRQVRHCPQCGSPLIARPVLKCAHCGEEVALRCFIYRDRERKGYIAECIDLNLLSQGKTPEDAIGRLQEAMFGYLQVAFEGGSTKGLVLRPSPLSHRFRYHARCIVGRSVSFLRRQHARHLLPKTNESKNLRFSHC